MTFAQLLGKSLEELEALTDEELHKYLDPYLPQTRPELVAQTPNFRPKNTSQNFASRKQKSMDDKIMDGKKQLILKILGDKGINIKL